VELTVGYGLPGPLASELRPIGFHRGVAMTELGLRRRPGRGWPWLRCDLAAAEDTKRAPMHYASGFVEGGMTLPKRSRHVSRRPD